MSVFQVMQKIPSGDETPDAVETCFIADRFSCGAALLTPLWAVAHGLWLELVLWVAGVIAIGLSAEVIGGEAAFWLYVLASFLIGFEAAGVRAAALKRRGYQMAGDIIAMAEDLAELEWQRRGGAA